MTEKRFTIDENGKYFDKKNKRYVTIDYLMDLINKLDEENQELKKELGELYIEKGNNEYYEDLLKEKDKELSKLKSELLKIQRQVNNSVDKIH